LTATSADELYRVHKLIVWASRNADFQRLLYKNDLLRATYNECLSFYHRMDFLDLKNETNINERKAGLYANLIKTCIQRFPDPASEYHKETVRTNFIDFITLALK
jgi:MoxR-like ATPase